MKKSKILDRILELIALISFIILAFIIGSKHEPWADEAQAWLLARDATIPEIITKYMCYEGSPPLWHIILKVFINFGMPYKYYFIIPLIFTSLGLIILEFKTDIPIYLKLIIPFTYYIFYQYTIVARSYCLIFPVLMLLTLIYNKKLEKPFLFGTIIILLLSISLHTCILAACISLIYGLQVLKMLWQYIRKEENIDKKLLIKNCIVVFILLAMFAITAYFMLPKADHSEGFINTAEERITYLQTIISDALATNSQNIKICLSVTILTFIIVFITYWKDKRIFEFLLLLIPLYLFLAIYYCNKWHIGIIFEVLLFIFIIHGKFKKNYYLSILFALACIMQIFYSFKTSTYDYSEMYSAAQDIAAFIKNNTTYENRTIYGVGYNTTAVEPYFDTNIFKNKMNNKGFYSWKKDDPEYMTLEEMKDNLPDILIISVFSSGENYSLINRIEVGQLYERYYFEGKTYIKDSVYESEGYLVYVSKNMLKEISNSKNTEVVIFN
jgi:hypothetical protein